MRRGLTLLGVAITLVGIGVVIVAFSLSPGPSGSWLTNVSVPQIAGGGNFTKVVSALVEDSASVVFTWVTSASLKVALYTAGSCAGNTTICPVGSPLATWWSNSGVWLYTGAVTQPWFLKIVNPNATSASFNGTLVEAYPAHAQPISGWYVTLLIVGALLLIAIGALAVFLGSFLRANPYRSPPPLVPPPDAGILGGPDDDLDDFGDDPGTDESDALDR